MVALNLFEEMAKGRAEFCDFCKPDTLAYNSITDGLYKEGFADKAGIFLQVKDRIIKPTVAGYLIPFDSRFLLC